MKTEYTMKEIREMAKVLGEKIVLQKVTVNGQRAYKIWGKDGHLVSHGLFTKQTLARYYYDH